MAFLEVAGDVGGAALGGAQEALHVGFDGDAPRTLVGTPVGVGDVAPDFSCREAAAAPLDDPSSLGDRSRA